MLEILIEFIVELFFRGWVSSLGAKIRLFVLKLFYNESEMSKTIYGGEGVFGPLTQEFYNGLVGFLFVGLFIFGIVWFFFV